MKQKIINSLEFRVKHELNPQSPLKYLSKIDFETIYPTIVSTVYLYTRPKKGFSKNSIYFAEIISAVGHNVRNKLKQKRDSALAAKTGAFILYTFQELGIIELTLGQGTKGHNSYMITVLNDDAITEMWGKLDPSTIEKLPSTTPYTPWTTTRHPSGATMVKTGNKLVLDTVRPETHPIIYSCINKLQAVGWNINKEIYNLSAWALRNKTDAFAEIWEQQNAEAKATKLREAKAIIDISKRFLNETFYHLFYFDFRFRVYPATAYLHQQGSDLARGLLLRADKKPITKEGFFWLMVSLANNWAGASGRLDNLKTDKIPLIERYRWSLDNEEILLSYAENPKVNQDWMKADSPWQFLAACFELKKFRDWQKAFIETSEKLSNEEIEQKLTEMGVEPYDYESHLECYIDGSNNGSQHLAALTKDEVTAPHVNLVPLDLPGDLYKYVADNLWADIDKAVKTLTKEEKEACLEYINKVIELKREIQKYQPKTEERQAAIDALFAYKQENVAVANICAGVFWNTITDTKERRKIVKRNVMTLPYGGTPYGLGEQQISDAKRHGIEILYYMEHKWGAYLGREIYENCRVSLERPMQLLEVFEQAGRQAENEGRFLSWTVPITNAPVVQNYTEGTTKKLWIQYGPPLVKNPSTGYYENTLQLAICFIELTKPSKGKQSSGASPNAIHSLDAAHLALTVHRAPFPITTIHDSFGCLLADMPRLYKLVRETFVELYEADPLSSLMRDIKGDMTNVKFGTLDIHSILDSEYAFS